MIRNTFIKCPISSLVGNRHVDVPENVFISLHSIWNSTTALKNSKITPIRQKIEVKGPLGVLTFPLHEGLDLKMKKENDLSAKLFVIRDFEEKRYNKHQRQFVKSMWGTTRVILENMIEGVSEGHHSVIKLVGVGYRASLTDASRLSLRVGYSHPIDIDIPNGLKVTIPQPSKIIIFGADLHKVTFFAAHIRAYREPEPYNGKGIYVNDEVIKRKEGKRK